MSKELDKNPPMITDSIDVEIFDDMADAPNYGGDTSLVKIEKACIVAKGTTAGNPTVDIQMTHANGQKLVVMITGNLLEMLGAACLGVRMRTNPAVRPSP